MSVVVFIMCFGGAYAFAYSALVAVASSRNEASAAPLYCSLQRRNKVVFPLT